MKGWFGSLRAGLNQHRRLGTRGLHCSMFDSVLRPSKGDKLNSLQFTILTFQNNEFVCSVQKNKATAILSCCNAQDQLPFRIACI